MKTLLLCMALPLLALAKVHYAKVEPYESVTLKSAISGSVLEADLDAEGKMVTHKRVIHIDDRLDQVDLNNTKESLELLQKMVNINKELAHSLQETAKRKKAYYTRMSKLSTASQTQIDNAYAAYASAKTQYDSIKEKILSLEKQLLDTRYKIAMLEDTIAKKSIVLDRQYLYKLMVKEGEFVAPGVPLARVDDASRAKIVLFLAPDELVGIENKKVYIDDKKTNFKVNKVWRVADERYVSSYRAEIYLPAPKRGYFSNLVKVELK